MKEKTKSNPQPPPPAPLPPIKAIPGYAKQVLSELSGQRNYPSDFHV